MISYSYKQEIAMKIKTKLTITLISIMLSSTLLSAANAQEANQQAMAQPPQAEIVTGGIGDGGMDAITAAQKNYDLKLIFSNPGGEYLSDVSLVIHNKKGDMVINTNSVGPVALVKLRPGTYTVSSSTGKETKTSKVVVKATGLSTYYIHLNDSES
jgi:hypothetical protein